MRWVIFCWSPSDRLPEPLRKDDFIVCADSGIEYACRCGVAPNLVLGDFDSYHGQLPDRCETIRLPAEKDDTDTMYAVRLGLQRGVDEFLIAGGIGGRADHFFGAVQTLNFIVSHGGRAVLSDGKQSAEILCGPAKRILKKKDGYVSLFSLSPCCEGVTLTGFRYPLTGAELTYDFPLGVSNEILDPEATVSFSAGRMLLIRAFDLR